MICRRRRQPRQVDLSSLLGLADHSSRSPQMRADSGAEAVAGHTARLPTDINNVTHLHEAPLSMHNQSQPMGPIASSDQ